MSMGFVPQLGSNWVFQPAGLDSISFTPQF
jgi:hypothetical protein